MTVEEDEPPIGAEPRTPVTSIPQWTSSTRTPSFAIDRPPKTNATARRAFLTSADDRWPRFPPSVFAPPVVAEIPSPRLDQLAREQEEGRWSV
jgi:hypothetical protein